VDLEPILKGVLPAIAAGLLLVSLGGARLLPLAAATGLYVAYGLLKRWPAAPTELWSSPNGIEWLLWSVIAAQLLSLLEYAKVWRGRLAMGSAAVLGAFSVWLVLQKLASRWSAMDIVLHIGGGAVAVALLALGMRSLLHRARPGPWSGFVVAVILSIDAVALVAGGSALLGQLCGALAAAVGAGVGTTIWKRGFTLGAADGTWIGIAHGLFLIAGLYLSSLSWTVAGLAAFSLVLLMLVGKQKSAA
jgi:hypothetical protein